MNEDQALFEKAEALREAERSAKARSRVDAWEKAMQRAFKGIMSRPQRAILLREALARAEKDSRS